MLLSLWDSVSGPCFVVRYCMSILVLQSSRFERESWLLCFVCLPGVSWLLCGSPSRCHWFCLQFVIVILPDNTHLLKKADDKKACKITQEAKSFITNNDSAAIYQEAVSMSSIQLQTSVPNQTITKRFIFSIDIRQ